MNPGAERTVTLVARSPTPAVVPTVAVAKATNTPGPVEALDGAVITIFAPTCGITASSLPFVCPSPSSLFKAAAIATRNPTVATCCFAATCGAFTPSGLDYPCPTGLTFLSNATSRAASASNCCAEIPSDPVAQLSNVAVTISTPSTTAFVGEPVIFTITVTSTGPGAAEGVVVTNTPPASLELVSVAPTGECAHSIACFGCNRNQLPILRSFHYSDVVAPDRSCVKESAFCHSTFSHTTCSRMHYTCKQHASTVQAVQSIAFPCHQSRVIKSGH